MTIVYHDDLEQGSDEWLMQRMGGLTASEVKLILTPTLKTANNDKTREHLYELLSQRITQHIEPQYVSDDMLRGHEDEITARDLYSEHYAPVTETGFVTTDHLGFMLGYSPDGLIGVDGLIEVKSRIPKLQAQVIVLDEVPKDCMMQLQTGLFVTQRDWIDYISYCAGMPMYVKRVFPIDEYQEKIPAAAIAFEEQLQAARLVYDANVKGLIETERNVEGDLI